jgi:hypothetical protein
VRASRIELMEIDMMNNPDSNDGTPKEPFYKDLVRDEGVQRAGAGVVIALIAVTLPGAGPQRKVWQQSRVIVEARRGLGGHPGHALGTRFPAVAPPTVPRGAQRCRAVPEARSRNHAKC